MDDGPVRHTCALPEIVTRRTMYKQDPLVYSKTYRIFFLNRMQAIIVNNIVHYEIFVYEIELLCLNTKGMSREYKELTNINYAILNIINFRCCVHNKLQKIISQRDR